MIRNLEKWIVIHESGKQNPTHYIYWVNAGQLYSIQLNLILKNAGHAVSDRIMDNPVVKKTFHNRTI